MISLFKKLKSNYQARTLKSMYNKYCCCDIKNIISDYTYQLETTEKYDKVLLQLKEEISYDFRYMEKCGLIRSRIHFKSRSYYLEYYST